MILNKQVLSRIQSESPFLVDQVAPSVQIQCFKGSKKLVDLKIGPPYKYFDIASLTKTVFTTPCILHAYDKGLIDLDDRLSDYLNWWPHESVTLRQLLTQTSGVLWWKPFYRTLREQKHNWISARKEIQSQLSRVRIIHPGKCVYSDLGFLLLGFLLEEVHKDSLVNVWNSYKKRIGLGKTIDFHLGNKPKFTKSSYAPTENSLWRGKILQGEVHDDNCWSMGGISSHAGLFASIDDVSQFGRLAVKGFNSSRGSSLGSQKAIRLFAKQALKPGKGDWALGWWKASKKGSSSGKYFSPQAVGGLGFTGTSLWMDPKTNLVVTILSNRVHPTRRNKKIQKFRPLVHNIIQEEIKKAKI